MVMNERSSIPYVTLGLGAEIFAVEVTRVREILDLCPISKVPNAPPFMLGMIDVRGCAVPVIDLRLKLGLPAIGASELSRILVLEVTVEGVERPMGLLADRVIEVTALAGDSLEGVPAVGSRWRSDYIRAIGRHNGTFVIIFDLTRLFNSGEAAMIERAA